MVPVITKLSMPPAGRTAVLYADGSCPVNPGLMGAGYFIESSTGAPIARVGLPMVGRGTNNRAEYEGLLRGLRHALRLGIRNITIKMDSQLVTRQVGGKYEVHAKNLRGIHQEVLNVLALFDSWKIEHIYREDNQEADRLSRDTLEFYEDIPSCPPPPPKRMLYPWQIALIRYSWLSGRGRSVSLLSRTFGVKLSTIEGIVYNGNYPEVDFAGYPS